MALGTFGFAAPEASTEALEAYAPDVLAFLGTDLGETSTAGWSPLLAKPPLKIHVDHDATQFHRVYWVELPVHADLALFLARLRETPPSRERAPIARPPTRRPRTPNNAAGVHPAELISVLSDVLPDDALVFCDIGNGMAWTLNGLPVRRRQELYIPMALGPMGSGLCAAIGAQHARPDRTVAVLVGDCAMTMHGTELLTAVGAGLPVKVIVLNDGGHGMVEHGLNLLGMPTSGLRLRRPVDFVAFGQSLGVEAKRVDTVADLRTLDWPRLWASGEPMLVEVMIDRDRAADSGAHAGPRHHGARIMTATRWSLAVLAHRPCLPPTRLTPADFVAAWSRPGRAGRVGRGLYRVASHETATDLETGAAREAIARAGWRPEDVYLLLGCTLLPEKLNPSNVALTQHKLGGPQRRRFRHRHGVRWSPPGP